MNLKNSFALFITMALVVSACGPTTPAKKEDTTKTLEAATTDAAIAASMAANLDPKVQKALLGLGIKLPTLPALTTQALKLDAAQNPLNVLLGVDLTSLAGITQQGSPTDPDSKLPRGTYERNAQGKDIKVSEEPKDGMVVNFTVNGVAFSQKVTYGDIKVLNYTYNNTSTFYYEVANDVNFVLSSAGEQLVTASVDTDATTCEVTNGLYKEQRQLFSKISASVNIANQITGSGTVSYTGTKGTASGNLKVVSNGHTAQFSLGGDVTTTLANTCANYGKPNDLTDAQVKANFSLDNNSAELKASVTGVKNSGTPQVEGKVDGSLTYSTPQYFATLATLTGNLKDGGDADNQPGDQAFLTYLTKNGNVTISLQALMAQFTPPNK